MNDIELIPLGKLRLSEANVRKNDSNLFIEELAANIEAKLASEADYLAAGGKIERDLFTEDGGETWIDAEIAQRIAGEKLQAFAAEVAQTSGYLCPPSLPRTRKV